MMAQSKVVTYYASTDPLSDPGLYSVLYSIMPAHRRRKIDQFIFDKDRRLSMGVELLLRRAMQDLGEDPDAFVSDIEGNGKPVLRGSDVHFNLSHSETMVMCSVSDSDVGCDVELIRPIDLEIAKRYFYGTEYDTIASQPDLQSMYRMFYRFWTLKESFMKVTGLGFELELSDFRINLGPRITVDQTVDDREYSFIEYDVGDGYRYAVSSVGRDFESSMRYVNLGGRNPINMRVAIR
jgi:4'-phosphopantetheinyl transferase